jgi:hypothetical protein
MEVAYSTLLKRPMARGGESYVTRSLSIDDTEHPRIIRLMVLSIIHVLYLTYECSSLGGDHTIVGVSSV